RKTTSREDFSQQVKREAVVGVVEDRDQNAAVGDIEIPVAGREAPAFEYDRRGHGDFDDLERLSVLIGGSLEAAQVLSQGCVVLVAAIGLDHGQDGSLCDKAGDVVDVAVGIVTRDAAAHPEYFLDTEIAGEDLLVVFLLEAGVTVLNLA